MHTKKTYQIYLNWILLSLFFAYQYVLRGIPGVFSNEIRQTFGLDASQFADLGACCMLVYSCLQIPQWPVLAVFCLGLAVRPPTLVR